MPVFVLYQTAFASGAEGVEVRPDFYGRDGGLWRRLRKNPPEQGSTGTVRAATLTPRRSPPQAG